jgi:RNA polymerase sigma-70 factor (ECF subfamily)
MRNEALAEESAGSVPLKVLDSVEVCAPITPQADAENWLPRSLPKTVEEEEVFVARLRPLILKFVRPYRTRRESEEDLVQMVFLKIFSKFNQYSGTVPLTHWVYRISVNTCLNQLSREKNSREQRHADLSEAELEHLTHCAGDPTAADPARDAELSDSLAHLLVRLESQDRRLLELLYLQGHTMEEASRITCSSVSAVKVRACRARQKLRRLLSEEFAISE